MCTVTYVPTKKGYVLTHNRDEFGSRTPSITPSNYHHNSLNLIYPLDPEGGGTWIALSEQRSWACILNGAFNQYGELRSRKLSRGKLVVEVLSMSVDAFKERSYSEYLPFTLLVLKDECFLDIRWDGSRLHCQELDKSKPQIWSSVNLYPKEIRILRERWFSAYLSSEDSVAEKIWDFHHSIDKPVDARFQMKMKIPEKQETVSVTQICQENNEIQYIHSNFASRNQLRIRPNFLNVKT